MRGRSGDKKLLVTDPEFSAKVRARMHSEDAHLVDPSKAQNIGGNANWNLRGTNLNRDRFYRENPELTPEEIEEKIEARYGKVLTREEWMAQALKNIDRYIVGVGRNATPATFAHEFRHDTVSDELQNRIEDVLHSASPEDYYRARDMIRDILPEGQEMSEEQLDEFLVSRMNMRARPRMSINTARQMQINRAPAKQAEQGIMSGIANFLGIAPKYTSSGRELRATDLKQRAAYPGLNFVGLDGMMQPK